MPHPDSFDAKGFDILYGPTRHIHINRTELVDPYVRDARIIKAAASAFLDAVVGIDVIAPIGGGYELQDVLGAMQCASKFDLDAYEAHLIDDAKGGV
jgi:hypothetical protein